MAYHEEYSEELIQIKDAIPYMNRQVSRDLEDDLDKLMKELTAHMQYHDTNDSWNDIEE